MAANCILSHCQAEYRECHVSLNNLRFPRSDLLRKLRYGCGPETTYRRLVVSSRTKRLDAWHTFISRFPFQHKRYWMFPIWNCEVYDVQYLMSFCFLWKTFLNPLKPTSTIRFQHPEILRSVRGMHLCVLYGFILKKIHFPVLNDWFL